MKFSTILRSLFGFMKPDGTKTFLQYYGFHCTGPKKKVVIKRLLLKILYPIVMLSYTIFGVIMAKKALAEFVGLTVGYDDLINNWKHYAITDIAVISGGAPCPTGHNPFVFKWPGTIKGCDCSSIAKADLEQQGLSQTVYANACDSKMIGLNCLPVDSTPAKDLIKIPNNGGTGQQICVKRAFSTFANTGHHLGLDGSCWEGEQLSGGSSANNGMYLYCFEGNTCPLTNIVVSSTNPSGGGVNYSKEANLYIEGETKGIWISRNGHNLPLVELTSSISHVCQQSSDVPHYGGPKKYDLLRETEHLSFSCKWGADPTYEKYFEFELQASMNENSAVQNTQELSDLLSQKKIGFFGRPFIPFKQACRGDIPEMLDNHERVQLLRTTQSSLYDITYAMLISIGIVFPVLFVSMRFLLHIECCKKMEIFWKIIIIILLIIRVTSIVLKIVNFITVGDAMTYASVEKKFFNELAEKKCSTDYINDLLAKLASKIQKKVYLGNLYSLLFLTAMTVYFCCVCACNSINRGKKLKARRSKKSRRSAKF